MGTVLPQTKRMIDALEAAGLKRSEFSVRTPCNSRGEYQPVQVRFASPPLNYVGAMLGQGLDVEILHYKNITRVFVAEGNGKLEEITLD
jgi:hypothetical protein